MLQDRVSELRRSGETIAGRVAGLRGEYWVRCSLTALPLTACDCRRPCCRHAAAIVQAFYARRLPVADVDLALDRFLEQPARAPLRAAALGEDLMHAFALPPEELRDLWALGGAERLLACEGRLRASPEPLALLRAMLPFAAEPGPVQDLWRSALADALRTEADWLSFFAAAPQALGPFLETLQPDVWPQALCPDLAAALWAAAARKDEPALVRLASFAARKAPEIAHPALHLLIRDFPALLGPYLTAARGVQGTARALAELWPLVESYPPELRRNAEELILQAASVRPRLAAALQLRHAAREGDVRTLMRARRAALRAGCWPRLRPQTIARLAERPDAALLETELWLADGDIAAAARCAARCRSSALPERLVGDALRREDPAAARAHYLRAQAVAERLGDPREAVARRLGRIPRQGRGAGAEKPSPRR